ncbi:MAG: hypothetical protein IIU14_08710 [Ruminococcus sp.]|nr:hypothetical protein [Ruminococcus sp.]
MRSSSLSHSTPTANRRRAKQRRNNGGFRKFGSVLVTSIVVFAAVIIPSVTLIQNVEAVTSKKNIVFSAGDNSVFAAEIVSSGKACEKSEKKEAKPVNKLIKVSVQAPSEIEAEKKSQSKKETAEPSSEEQTAASSEAVSVSKNKGTLSTANVDSSYSPRHVQLSEYDREKTERLVMGEAGGMGYNGSALVAQAIRDSMIESNTNSIDYIIENYQYEGSTETKPTAAVKKAVSDIFDNDGYAVQHRILYFYASDLIDSEWHESQQFIISYGSERFFDSWD